MVRLQLEFYKELKTEFTDFNILKILPFENVSQINFKSTHFYSKNLREIASIVENSVVFIGADSGIMHLSSSTNTTTIGLFNVTSPRTYEPYGDKNESIDTSSIKITEIIKKLRKQYITIKDMKIITVFVHSQKVNTFAKSVQNDQYTHFTLFGMATEVGFSSKTSFNATFKKVKGLAPAQFKNSIAEIKIIGTK